MHANSKSFVENNKSYVIEVDGFAIGYINHASGKNTFSLDPDWVNGDGYLYGILKKCCVKGSEQADKPSEGFLKYHSSKREIPQNIIAAAADLRDKNARVEIMGELESISPLDTEEINEVQPLSFRDQELVRRLASPDVSLKELVHHQDELLTPNSSLRNGFIDLVMSDREQAPELDEVPDSVIANIEEGNVLQNVQAVVILTLLNSSVTMTRCHLTNDNLDENGKKVSESRVFLDGNFEWKGAELKLLNKDAVAAIIRTVEASAENGELLNGVETAMLKDSKLRGLIAENHNKNEEVEPSMMK